MCSILFTNKKTKASDYNLLKLRGPDSTTEVSIAGYNFVHNLLSLTGEFTEQPIQEDGIILLFNGEIYNYKELFPLAKSDSYSIIAAYKKYGPKFIKKLDGEFAIVLVDIDKQIILFSADIFKTKPLFYSIEKNEIGISTFQSPLKKLGFNNIQPALANTCCVIDLVNSTIDKFTIKEFSLNQYKTDYKDWFTAFDIAIKKRATQSGNNKTFIGLSSGYDSGAIACALNKLEVDNKSYSIYASENREVIDSRIKVLKNAETINLTTHQYEYWYNYIQNNCEDFISNQYNGYNIKNDKASVGLAYICDKAIKDGRKIYLSGQGADEIFSDYGMYGRMIMGPNQSTFGGIFPDDLNSVFPWKNFFDGTMEMYIAKEEYVAGSFGIETRYPYLDAEVVQEFLWLSPDLKNKSYKSVVYEYLKNSKFPLDKDKKIGFQANRNLI
jgi:asparagine synthetase B (glutamine-hydrolysing)